MGPYSYQADHVNINFISCTVSILKAQLRYKRQEYQQQWIEHCDLDLEINLSGAIRQWEEVFEENAIKIMSGVLVYTSEEEIEPNHAYRQSHTQNIS